MRWVFYVASSQHDRVPLPLPSDLPVLTVCIFLLLNITRCTFLENVPQGRSQPARRYDVSVQYLSGRQPSATTTRRALPSHGNSICTSKAQLYRTLIDTQTDHSQSYSKDILSSIIALPGALARRSNSLVPCILCLERLVAHLQPVLSQSIRYVGQRIYRWQIFNR